MPKILVADDNTNIQKMVSLALEERGINVVSVGNGEAAVRRIPDVNPDLVLADIFMPVRNGYEVCEFVKKNERFAHVPVILLVGAFDPLDEKEARRVGADDVLKKPFVPPDPLIAMVTSALERNPRVAAEMAKAKEAKAPAPEPELPKIDLSSRPEPKPLPKFPEPSPEEAELVYGMGKGQRSMDSDHAVEAGHAGPVAPREADEEDLDAASTTSDWRRSAMDFEIPADVASKPAIPTMDDLDPISFPSEKDYPPRHVSAPEPAEEEPVIAKEEQVTAKDEPVGGSPAFSLRQIEESEADIPRESVPPEAAPEIQLGAFPEPNSTALGGHWLDAVAAAQTENPGAWFESLSSPPAETPAAPMPLPETAEHLVEVAEAPGAAEANASFSTEEVASSAAQEESSAPSYSESPLQLEDHESQSAPGTEQSFFADEPEMDASAASSEEHEGAFDTGSGAAGRDIELDASDSEPSLAFKDPALVEPPAVHVTPEPLLVDEESGPTEKYGLSDAQSTPARSIFAPLPEIPAPAAEFSLQAAPEQPEPSNDLFDERIPTMPPPNREALAHIPFLTPPPSFLAELKSGAPHEEPPTVDPQTVDSVVQKVLEKLQPQLQELLSQGLLKPIVENILQNNVPKKL